jgi:hypothetical protein
MSTRGLTYSTLIYLSLVLVAVQFGRSTAVFYVNAAMFGIIATGCAYARINSRDRIYRTLFINLGIMSALTSLASVLAAGTWRGS